MADRIEQQLGNYRLVHLLGKGGFAEVYLGEHVHLRMPAAIKVLQAKMSTASLEDFLSEARTITRLIHPNIVRVLDFGVDGDTAFLVMDYASNGTLRERHSKGSQIELPTVIFYVKQVAEALQYAHNEQVIHRDLKPENILLNSKNEVLLSDFGISLMTQSSRYQDSKDILGTVAYMAPEQIQGKPRPASDQYALGVVVYEWLSGTRPFHGSITELCAQHIFVPPPPLREKIPTISPVVEQVVVKALAKDAHKRFSTVQEFADALEQASKKSQPIPIPPLPPSPLPIEPPPVPSPPPEKIIPEPSPPPVIPVDHEGKVNVWSISRHQIMAMILGALLFGGLTYFINSLLLHNGIFDSIFFSFGGSSFGAISVGNLLISAAFLIPLFFGIAFGPWVGLFTGLVGSLIGNYLTLLIFQGGFQSRELGLSRFFHSYFTQDASNFSSVDSFHKYLFGNSVLDRYDSAWRWYIGVTLIGFIVGLVLLRTKGRYNETHAITTANIIAVIAAIIGIGFITLSDIWALQFDPSDALGEFLSLALPTVIISLILIPKLLRPFKEGVEHLISRLLRSSKAASTPIRNR